MPPANGQRRPLRRGETKAPSEPRTFGPRPELRAPPALPDRPRQEKSHTDILTEHPGQMQLNEATTFARTGTDINSGRPPEKSELPPEFQPASANFRQFLDKFFGQTDPSQWYGGQLPPFPQNDAGHTRGPGARAGPNHELMQTWGLQSAQALREDRARINDRIQDWVQEMKTDESRSQLDHVPVERDELLRSIESSSDNIDTIANIMAYTAENRGMGAKKLKEVIAPAREIIRRKIGAEGLTMMDALFEEQAAREAAYYDEDEKDTGQVSAGHSTKDQDGINQSARTVTERSGPSPAVSSTRELHQVDTVEAVERIRDYGRLKNWSEFRALFELLSDHQLLEPELAIWTANTIFAQGCVKESAEMLDRCWEHHAQSELPLNVSICLQTARAAVSFYSTCKVSDMVQQLLTVRNILTEGEVHLAPAPLEALAESQSHRLMQVAFDEGVLDETVFRPVLLARAKSMTALLRDEGRIDDAIGLACWAATWMQDQREKSEYLRGFLGVIERPVSRAEIWLELASLTTDSTIAADCRQQARDIYVRLHAECHLLNVELEELSMRPAQTMDNMPTLLRVAENCRQLDFYIGQIRALQTACTIAVTKNSPYSDTRSLFVKLRSVVEHTGNRYLGVSHDLQHLAACIQTPEHLGRAIVGLREALDHEEYQLPAKIITIMSTLTNGYIIVGDVEKSLHYSKLALDRSSMLSNHNLVSICVSQRATALLRSGSKQDLLDGIELLEMNFAKFAETAHHKGQREMCALLIQTERRLTDLLVEEEDSRSYHAGRVSHWTSVRDQLPSQHVFADMLQLAEDALATNQVDMAEMLIDGALGAFTKTNNTLGMAECRRVLFHCTSNRLLQSDGRPENLAKDLLLRTQLVLKCNEATQTLAQLKSPTQFLSRAARELYTIGRRRPDWKDLLYSGGLRCLSLAAREGEKFRTGLVEDQRLNSLLQKRMFVSDSVLNLDYALGLRMSLTLQDARQMWNWIQEYKAQALADVVGSQYSMPATSSETTPKDSVKQLLLDEADLQNRMVESSETSSGVVQQQLDGVRAAIDQNPLLHQVRYVKSARLELDNLDWLFAGSLATELEAPAKVVLVDWVVYDDRVVRTTLDATLIPEMKLLDMTAREIALFNSRNMSSSRPFSDRNTLAELTKLEPLMADLDRATNENDLLVFSPSGLLNALPLHALRIGGRQAIDRNLIVYTSSLGVLKHCHERQTRAAEERHRTTMPSTALFSHFPGEDGAEERAAIHACVDDISHLLSAEVYLEQAATSTQFIKTASQADILHYHGHVSSHPNILEHALELHSDDPAETAPRLRNRSLETGRFTTRDAFSLQLRGSLITMVGCGSGVQDVAAGDEPMGLMSALMCAGAATAVGTLWPINSKDGRDFAREFYYSIANQMQARLEGTASDGGASLVNLAVAMRQAVRSIKEKRRTSNAYHWAAFVMCGTWMM